MAPTTKLKNAIDLLSRAKTRKEKDDALINFRMQFPREPPLTIQWSDDTIEEGN